MIFTLFSCHQLACKLVLSPLSRAIGHRKVGDPTPKHSVDLGELKLPFGEGDKVAFHIQYMFKRSAAADAAKWIAPYWLVSAAAQDMDPNMTVVQKQCTVEVGEYKCKLSVPVLQNTVVIAQDEQLSFARAD